MLLCGLNKTTLLDYPGHVAATLFTGGCNFRCPFCHNRDLVLAPEGAQHISAEEIWRFLEKRKGVLQGVCITGGEPTLQPDLPDFIRKVKGLGYRVKLDTNGYRPQVLKALLEEGLLDYAAMDIKASKESYAKVIGLEAKNCSDKESQNMSFDIKKIAESVELLKRSSIPYEFRTTVVKGLHTPEEFEEIGKWLQGARAYYLQAYREDVNVICPGFGTFSVEEMEEMRQRVAKYVEKAVLRGVDGPP